MHEVDDRSALLFSTCSGRAAHTCPAPLRWKQHEAYVQVLEAKYTELCCKYRDVIPAILFIPPDPSDFSPDGIFLRRLSQRRDGAEGVGGKAQAAAAAGVCAQGEHLGHAARHQGAGNARVHGTCRRLHLSSCPVVALDPPFFIACSATMYLLFICDRGVQAKGK